MSMFSSTAVINTMAVLCDAAWLTNSNLAATGHIYSYDWQQNAYFPANIAILGKKNVAVLGTDANGYLKAASVNPFLYDDLGNI